MFSPKGANDFISTSCAPWESLWLWGLVVLLETPWSLWVEGRAGISGNQTVDLMVLLWFLITTAHMGCENWMIWKENWI